MENSTKVTAKKTAKEELFKLMDRWRESYGLTYIEIIKLLRDTIGK